MDEKVIHLKLMKKYSGLVVKASGNIKTLDDIKKVLRAGASIVGTSSGVKIMKSLK